MNDPHSQSQSSARFSERENSGIAQSSIALSSALPLQKDILKVLAYFDIFRHPLTPKEIYSFLPSNSTTVEKVARACVSAPLSDIVTQEEGYYALTPEIAAAVNQRREKESRARSSWRIAVIMSRIISHFPFVRAVFVSGELSKGVASLGSDIDYVIVTKAKRLWISRTFLILFKKLALLNSKKYFCLNLFVAEDRLDSDSRNLYAATEIATLKPLYNHELFERYHLANQWIGDYFPNWDKSRAHSSPDEPRAPLIRRTLELLFDNKWGDELDSWLMNRWGRIWKNRYPDLSDEQRNRLFQCHSHISTAFGEDFLDKVLREYNKRLEGFSIN
jgi:hypothetical protein